jgi:uncharacterized protein (TIGR02687 family)
MSERIALALSKLFDRHRVVFWYDAAQELRAEYEGLELPGVEKLELTNNEYQVKYRILREQPEQKFLLYREGPPPADLDNWLLDLQLAQGEFRADQVAIWLSELEIGLEFADLVGKHRQFFKAARRRESLRKLLKGDDTAGMIRWKMLAVCVGSEPRLDAILEHLLQELAEENEGEKFRLVKECRLDGWFWEQMARQYGYKSTQPSERDLVIRLFKDCYLRHFPIQEPSPAERLLDADALVFLKRWKDSRLFEKSFEKLSNECAEVLGIEQDLEGRDFRELIELDYFRLIDQKVIRELVRAVTARTVSAGEVALWVRQRRQGHWYQEFQHLYEAIDDAARFLSALGEARLVMESLVEGVERYSSSWCQLDQLYRKFTYHVRMAGQASLMNPLSDLVENLYSNNYLLKLGDRFQVLVDEVSDWSALPVRRQRSFFEHYVQPFLCRENKVCVIISDALRYEIGEELLGLIRQQDRYSAELEAAVSMLPSYTQLGMAALLPGRELAIAENETGSVLVDGQNSRGTANRSRILGQALSQRATACQAEEIMAMKGDDCRALVREHDVIYVYHNRIDATGDKRDSEERVFEAVEETLSELVRLIKKLTGANVSNLLVTADHGFIYQNRAIDESDYSGVEVEGKQVIYRNRRFVLGQGLVESPGLRKFTSTQLGLAGGIEVMIPKSINRLRLKGSGSRFVHGGASLQEIVIPVLRVNKKRQSDVSAVEVEILRGANTMITSGQVAVILYQTSPVTEKVHPRLLRAGIYTEAGELISDSHELNFDLSSENPRERELQVRFVLSRKADAANGREVILRLDERHEGTSHFKEYKSLRYLMRRSFTSDFDF